MKIIKPVLNVGNLSTNDAPVDALSTWTPTSRDLLGYIDKPVFDAIGNTMVVTSSTSGGSVYSVNLATGIVSDTGYSSGPNVFSIRISPDETSAAIARNGARTVITISTGAVVFNDAISSESSLGLGVPFCWTTDSSILYSTLNNEVSVINAVNWTKTSTTINIIFESVFIDGVDLFLSGRYAFGLSDSRIVKMTNQAIYVSDQSVSSLVTSIISNPVTGDLLGLMNDNKIRKIDKVALTVSNIPALSGSFYARGDALRATATHLITRALFSPYWNYFLLSDYSLSKSLADTADIGERIAAATSYTVIQQDAGVVVLNASDVPESQVNPSVVAGDKYIYTNSVYEVLIDNADQPSEGANLAVPTWLDTGFINPLRLFDGKLDSLTTAPQNLTITINPNELVTGVALFNLTASNIQITMTDPQDGLVFDTGIISLFDNSAVNDWFAYFNDAYIGKADYATLSLPAYPLAEIVITINGEGSSVSVGEVVIGRVINIGTAQYGTGTGILDFSQKEQDQFGNFNILERKFSKRADYDVKLATNQVSGVQRTLAGIRATPIVWVGDVEKEETIIYGYYRSFDIVLSNPALSEVAIEVEGL